MEYFNPTQFCAMFKLLHVNMFLVTRLALEPGVIRAMKRVLVFSFITGENIVTTVDAGISHLFKGFFLNQILTARLT